MLPTLLRTARGAVASNAAAKPRAFVTVIDQAECAFREFLGSNRVPLAPGLHLNLPLLHSLKRVDMRAQQQFIKELHGTTQDNLPVVVSGTFVVQVQNAAKAVYAVQDYRAAVSQVVTSALRAAIGSFKYDDIIADRLALSAKTLAMIEDVAPWGVSVNRVDVQSFAPQTASVAQQLERQMTAERNRRENELNTAAAIKTAEGDKAAAILRSEGALVAARNVADGQRYALETGAAGLAAQLHNLSAALGDTTAAQALLVEMRRLDVLAALAASPNRVYVVPAGTDTPTPLPLATAATKAHGVGGVLALEALVHVSETDKH